MNDVNYVLKLYIAGTTPNSLRAVANLTALCEEHLKNRHTLEVVDIYQHPEKTKEADIIAAPTLIRQLPEPIRTLIGDMSDKERVLMGLEIETKQS